MFFGKPLLFGLVVATALILRTSVVVIGPLAEPLRAALAIDYAVYGCVSALPLLLFGLLSPLTERFLRFISVRTLYGLSLLLICAGAFVRAEPVVLWFIARTVLSSLGVANLNVLLPAVIKTGFPSDWPRMMSGYAALIGLSSTVGAATAVPIAHWTGDYADAIRFWGLAVLPALLFLFGTAKGFGERKPREDVRPFGSTPRLSWALVATLTAVTGLQAMLNGTVSLWMPSALTAKGLTPDEAAELVTLFLLFSIVGAFVTPRVAALFPHFSRRAPGYALPYGATLLAVFVCDDFWMLTPFAALAGLFQGFLMAETFALPARKTNGFAQLVALTGRTQCGGFLLAGLGPTAVGAVVSLFSIKTVPWTLVAMVILWAVFARQAETVR